MPEHATLDIRLTAQRMIDKV